MQVPPCKGTLACHGARLGHPKGCIHSQHGAEWLFTLLEPLDKTTRMIVLMIMWRTWHVRNEITHEKRPPPTESSRRFLHGYISSLLCLKQYPNGDVVKGKMVINDAPPAHTTSALAKDSYRLQVWQEVG